MNLTIEISDESAALLRRQAAAHGLTLGEFVQTLAREKAQADDTQSGRRQRAQAAAARIREIQKRVKPDPEGWTARDYIDHGRR